ncbi:TRAP transporter small permease [Roseovarius pacificus]|uniref:TRAP transporter small permease n=1 Tax=Roseovarius pacificus TaxID=337701 RepID=UPI002A18E284|nr:TRAP transporter small permease [Roseovarius pacificus]
MRNRIEGILAGLLLIGAVALVLAEILLRTLLSYSLIGVDGIASILVIWSTFLGASYALHRNMHVRVDLLHYCVSPRIALALDTLVTVACLIIAMTLTWSGVLLIDEALMLGETTMGFVRIPMWAVQSIMPLAGALFALRLAQRLVLQLQGIRQQEEEDIHVGGT